MINRRLSISSRCVPKDLLTDSNLNLGKKYIVIIGAGPSGLATLKAVLESHEWRECQWDVVALEAREEVGGVWLPAPSNHPAVPDPSTKPALIDGSIDCSRISPPLTPLYDSLTTNIPHPVMAYSAFPFPPSTPLFPKAKVVEDYLKDYARIFGLYKHIRFNERVVKAEFDHGTAKWIVQTLSSSQAGYDKSMRLTYTSDLLLICNGHHNVPRYPPIPGLDAWLISNCAAHSMFYRSPDCAPWRLEKRSKILVVGGGPSGQDIVTDLIAMGSIREIIHSASRFKGQKPERVTLRGKLVKLGDVCRGEADFEGGVLDEGIDFVIFATGYEVQVPFLSEKYIQKGIPSSHLPMLNQGLWNTSYGLFPLVRYLFPFSFGCRASLDLPSPTSIFFLGLPVRVVPMPLVEVQARLALSIFAKHVQVEWDVEAREVTTNYENLKALVGEEGVHKRYFRLEPMEQFDYRDEIVGILSNAVDGNSVRRVRLWEREMYTLKDVIRKEWRELEASGEAVEWVRDVGKGKSGSSPEEEWVALMRRVAVRST